jgi:hypothetical protein
MLDLIGATVGMLAIGVCLVAITQFVPGTLAGRLSIGALVGGWVGLATHLGSNGSLAFSPDHPVPLIGVLCAAPLLVFGVLALASRAVRATLLAVPLPILIGVNSLRMLGVLFLMLAASGRLSGPFPYFAGLGDVITGALALPLALRLARNEQWSAAALRRWNVFGALDLIVAISLGVTTAEGSPVRLIHSGVGSEAMQHLPYCLVPTVLVPFYLMTHAVIAARLRAMRRSLLRGYAGQAQTA